MMRGLTLHRPWDWAIAHGGKNVENRPWKPWAAVVGQRIALHAGKVYDYDGDKFIRAVLRRTEPLPQTRPGWIHLIEQDGKRLVPSDGCAGLPFSTIAELEKNPWLFGPYGWVLVDTVALPKPVPCAGALALWKLPVNVEAEVLRQEEAARSKSA
jgi:hypothetical protein